jgi:hypothetical protein
MPVLNKYTKRKAHLLVGSGVAMTPAAVEKAEEKAEKKVEKQQEEQVRQTRKQLFRAWTKF